jgi:hypothetical protein
LIVESLKSCVSLLEQFETGIIAEVLSIIVDLGLKVVEGIPEVLDFIIPALIGRWAQFAYDGQIGPIISSCIKSFARFERFYGGIVELTLPALIEGLGSAGTLNAAFQLGVSLFGHLPQHGFEIGDGVVEAIWPAYLHALSGDIEEVDLQFPVIFAGFFARYGCTSPIDRLLLELLQRDRLPSGTCDLAISLFVSGEGDIKTTVINAVMRRFEQTDSEVLRVSMLMIVAFLYVNDHGLIAGALPIFEISWPMLDAMVSHAIDCPFELRLVYEFYFSLPLDEVAMTALQVSFAETLFRPFVARMELMAIGSCFDGTNPMIALHPLFGMNWKHFTRMILGRLERLIPQLQRHWQSMDLTDFP